MHKKYALFKILLIFLLDDLFAIIWSKALAKVLNKKCINHIILIFMLEEQAKFCHIRFSSV